MFWSFIVRTDLRFHYFAVSYRYLSPTRKETSCACQKCDGHRNGL